MLEDGWQRYFKCQQIDKRTCAVFDDMEHKRTALLGPYINRGEEPIYQPSNEKKPWNGKLIRKLLLVVTVVDLESFTPKDKPVTYTGAFVELYN